MFDKNILSLTTFIKYKNVPVYMTNYLKIMLVEFMGTYETVTDKMISKINLTFKFCIINHLSKM